MYYSTYLVNGILSIKYYISVNLAFHFYNQTLYTIFLFVFILLFMSKTQSTKHIHSEEPIKEPQVKDTTANDSSDETPIDDSLNQQDTSTYLENATELEELKTQLEEAQTSAKESYDKMLRIQAEMENLRRRNAKDIESAHKFALEKFAKSLLEVVDSMSMGIKSMEDAEVTIETIKDGMDMTHKMLLSTLEKFEINSINPTGEELNPEKHEAISMVSVPDTKANTIIDVVQIGWELNGRVIRPAMVIVAS